MKKEQLVSRRDFLKIAGVSGVMLADYALARYLTQEQETEFTEKPDWELDFSSQEDGSQPSRKEWNYFTGTGYNEEAQVYTDSPANIRVEEGVLLIEAHKDGSLYTSARIDSQGKKDFLYGKFEVTAQLPEGAGTWPALWLRVTDLENEKVRGEIDFMEAQGAHQQKIFFNVHTETSIQQGDQPYSSSLVVKDPYSQFHNYGVEWTPERIVFTVDGVPCHQVLKYSADPQDWPFDLPCHLVINLAMGGRWAKSAATSYGLDLAQGIDDSQQGDWQFKIKKIAYYPWAAKK